MNKQQIIRLLKVAIVAVAIILVGEIIFAIPTISNSFISLINSARNTNKLFLVYIVLWLIMFGQVTILNIPAYTVLSASVAVGLLGSFADWIIYIVIVLSAYEIGAILAYWLGRKFGSKAVKWVAGSQEDFDKWSDFINKKGKWPYFLTILFPMFPDDLLCIVAGSVKMNFGFYTIANLIGRGVGLIAMLGVLKLLKISNSNFPYMIIVWSILLLVITVLYLVLKHKENKDAK